MEERSVIKNIIIFMLVVLSSNLNGQSIGRSKKNKSNVEKFVLVPFAEAIHSDSIKIVTFIEIPFLALQFVKEGDEFKSGYQASIGIKGKNSEDLGHQVWTDTIKVSDYSYTKSGIKNRKHYANITIPVGGKYEVIGELQDNDTRKKGIRVKKLNFKAYSKLPVLMPPIFLLNLEGDWGFETGKIPTNGFRVREIGDGIDLKVSGFVDSGKFDVDIYLSNGTAIDSLMMQFSGYGDLGYFNENIFIPANQLKSLKNDFKIVLTQNGTTDIKKTAFSTYKPGISNYVYNIDMALRQMKYVMTNDERLQLKKKSKKDKEQLFYSFWKSRDPTPETEYNELMEEYYGRVWYANEHFDAWQPGWETDRGMIYVLFGPPDEIQRTHSSTSMSSLYQTWSYYKISKQFIFKDLNGFGDFRLETPFLGAGL
jgi:GWxTD domain-containing protein